MRMYAQYTTLVWDGFFFLLFVRPLFLGKEEVGWERNEKKFGGQLPFVSFEPFDAK